MESEIKVELFCTCGNTFPVEHCKPSRSCETGEGPGIFYYDGHMVHICAGCGTEMQCRVAKTLITKTETKTII